MSEEDWADIPDSEFAKIPAVKNHVNRATSRQVEKLNREHAEKVKQEEAYATMARYFDERKENDPGGLLRELDSDPGKARWYAAVKEWKLANGQNGTGRGPVDRESVANDMVQGLIQYLRDEDDWKHLNEDTIDEIFAEKDMKRILGKLLATGSKRAYEQALAKAKEEGEARYNDLLAKRNLSASEPEPPAGGVIGQGDGLTLPAYHALSTKERRELRKRDPGAIDQMMVALQEAQVGVGAG